MYLYDEAASLWILNVYHPSEQCPAGEIILQTCYIYISYLLLILSAVYVQLFNINFMMSINSVNKRVHACMGVSFI